MGIWQKWGLVVRAFSNRGTHWTQRVLLAVGMGALVGIPLSIFSVMQAMVHHAWVSAIVAAITAPVLATFWGAAWRRALDRPMGDAWFNLPSIARPLGLAYLVIAVLNAYQHDWAFAVVNVAAAAMFWFRRGPGGGWDDPVDAPQPDPSTSA